MNEAETFTCPHCRKTGAGIVERRTAIVETRVLGLDTGEPSLGDPPLQMSADPGHMHDVSALVYVCAACRHRLASTAEDMAGMLAGEDTVPACTVRPEWVLCGTNRSIGKTISGRLAGGDPT